MKVKIIKIKRLFHGYASARDYQVDEAIKNKQAIRFVLPDGRTMTVPYEKLKTGYWNKEYFTSKQNPGQKYCLVDYDFKADPREVQENLFSS